MSDGPRARRPDVALAVAGIALLALAARLVLLGDRVAHWDEARVGYWVLEFAATGDFHYRPIIHGPFLQHVNRRVFALLGASDFTMRLVPALVGGLLPLAALALRDRLRDAEVVGLALFLAANPVLLYYSRFMRGDLLVGAFMFGGFALLVWGIDAGDRRALFPAVALVALGFTVKENALAYLLAWLGAAVLLLDHRLVLARAAEEPWTAVLGARLRRVGGTLRNLAPALALAAVEFVAIVVWFYAPRGDVPSNGSFYRYCAAGHTPIAGFDGVVGLGSVLANPGAIPDIVLASTVGSAEVFVCQWVGPRATQEGGNAYLYFLGDLAKSVGYGAGALVVLALVGFVVDRYGGERPRDLVQFASYWGVASLAGYPLITDIPAPWPAVHVVLPLAVPAAVGLAHVYRFARRALSAGDRVGFGVAAAVLLLVGVQVGAVAGYTSYAAPEAGNNDLVQYAQPAGDARSTLADMAAIADDNDGPDVLLYGDFYVDGGTNAPRRPACARWFNALPLPWYFETGDVDVVCAGNATQLDGLLADGAPPVVVTRANVSEGRAVVPPELAGRLAGHEPRVHRMRTDDTLARAVPTVFFVRRNATGR